MVSEDLKENLIALVIVLVIAVGASWWIYSQVYKTPELPTSPKVNVPLGASPRLGNESAPVTVVIFSDFECPFCGEFARDTFPKVKAQYIDTGKVQFVFKQFPLETHPDAALAAEASLCAEDQGKFWEYHDMLYAHQDALEQQSLEQYAKQLNLDMATFTACLNGTHAQEVAAEKAAGQRLGVAGTPTFFFNGEKVVGALSFDDFTAAMQK